MKKQEKVSFINKIIGRNPSAKRDGARAKVLKDGRIEYSRNTKSGMGRIYRIKIKFSDILWMLEGKDARLLKGKFGRKRKTRNRRKKKRKDSIFF